MKWDNAPVYRRRRRAVAGGAALLVAAVTVTSIALTRDDSPAPDAVASPAPTSAAPRWTVPPRSGKAPAITIAFGGDVNAQGQAKRVNSAGLGEVGGVFAKADLAMVNLETVIVDDTSGLKPQPKTYTFATGPALLDTLDAAGVDVVTAANNHGMDYGVEGMKRMLQVKAKSPVPIVGIGADDTEAWAPWVTEVKGRKVVIFGATDVLDDHLDWKAAPNTPGLAKIRDASGMAALVRAVRQARTEDPDAAIVVYLHSGTELVRCPTKRQRAVSQTFATAGADVVIGSHAHILQTTASTGNTAIAYGIGNFVFEAHKDTTRATGVLTVTIPSGQGAPAMDFAPARITNGVPVLLSGAEKQRALQSWEKLGEGCS